MGVDVNLYAEAIPTDQELAMAEEFFVARSRFGDPDDESNCVLVLDDSEWNPTPRVVVRTMARYYSHNYERGNWPEIYGAIRVLQAAFPEAKVFYGGDSTDDGIEVDDNYLSEIWTHFLGPNGDRYHQPTDQARA